jgi:hypothetical protein
MRTRTARTWIAAAAVVALLPMLGGCRGGDGQRTVLADLFEPIMPPTPGEAARDAFNVYDPDARRRSVALISASQFADEGPYVRLYRLLLDDPDPTVRAACLAALGRNGSPSDGPAFVDHLRHEASFVRWESAKALQKVHYPAAIRPLINTMREDEDVDVRMAAAAALGQYRERFVFDALIGALNDRDFGVREAASQSLFTLTGQDLGVDSVAWLAWGEGKTPDVLFADAQPYKWQPYVQPRGIISRMQFWKKYEAPAPRPPAGIEANAQSSPGDEG